MSDISIKSADAAYTNTVGIVIESLFTNHLGFWIDPSTLSSLAQNSDGSGAVASAGDPVGLIRDRSGYGYNAAQATAANRATFQNGGGYPRIQFDGTNDFYSFSAAALDLFRNKGAGFLCAAVQLNTDTASVISYLNNSSSSRANIGSGSSGAAARAVGRNTDGSSGVTSSFGARPATPYVISGIFRYNAGQQIIARLNGVAGTPAALSAAANTSNTSSAEACLGKLSSAASSTTLMNGSLYGALALDFEPSALQIAAIEAHFGRKCGILL